MKESAMPTEELRRELGHACPHYQAFLAELEPFAKERKRGTSGWLLKIQSGKKALCYLSPKSELLGVSLAIREDERKALLANTSLAEFKDAISASKKVAEGFVLRFEVADAASCESVLRLIAAIAALRR